MKHYISIVVFSYISFCTILGQIVIKSEPAFPSLEDEVVITFYANEGNKGLIDYSGDIWAHTGVITSKSSSETDWKYVKAEWNENIDDCKLTQLENNIFQLTISPSIKEFYNIPQNEHVEKIAFVFRNSDGSLEGKDVGNSDIFVDVANNNLNVAISSHKTPWVIAEQNDTIAIRIVASQHDSLYLIMNDSIIAKTTENEITYNFIAFENSSINFIAKAINSKAESVDSIYFLVAEEPLEEGRPENSIDGITYLSSTQVQLVLHAPYKQNIFVLGDFNHWLPSNHFQMKKDQEHWWIVIDSLEPGKEYAFQYLIDKELVIADPYCTKILDPWNDKYIPDEVYPNLKSYPTNKTQNIAGVIQTDKPTYIWKVDDFTPVENSKLNIYELLIRDFVESHYIKHVEDSLNYLKSLGINAIELMPFNEFEGNSSWGYNPSFYFATDKYYGMENDYKSFIDACHENGIAVIMDIVFNHAYGQCPLVQLYFEANKGDYGQPSMQSPWFNETSPNTSYSWGYDFNHKSIHTQRFIQRALKYWMEEFKIDGFRFDFTKGFTNTPGDGWEYDATRISTLKEYYNYIKSIDEDAVVILEHLTENREEKELADFGMLLWGNLNYAFNEATMGYDNNSDLSWANYQKRGWNMPNLIAYMESHDEERLMYKNLQYGNEFGDYNIQDTLTALKRNELATVFYYSIPGPKMIWQFGELGYDYSIDYNGRVGEKPVRWDYLNDPNRRSLYEVYAKMSLFREKIPAFTSNQFTLDVGNNVELKSIYLNAEDDKVIVLGNFGMSEDVIAPFNQTGWWYNILNGDSLYVFNQSDEIGLEAGEYQIFSNNKYEFNFHSKEIMNTESNLFPNPATNYLYLTTSPEETIQYYSIYSFNGSSIKSEFVNGNRAFIDIRNLMNGLYMLQYKVGDSFYTKKFLKLN